MQLYCTAVRPYQTPQSSGWGSNLTQLLNMLNMLTHCHNIITKPPLGYGIHIPCSIAMSRLYLLVVKRAAAGVGLIRQHQDDALSLAVDSSLPLQELKDMRRLEA